MNMDFKRLVLLVVLAVFIVATPVVAQASNVDHVRLMVIEHFDKVGKKPETEFAVPFTDNSMTNPDYVLLGFHWSSTANYWINPSNKYGFSASQVVNVIRPSAEVWDLQTSFQVFSYMGTTSRQAGKYDGYNVVSWGNYRAGVIAVTYIWYIGLQIIETDTRMNTYYRWSISGEAGKMDVQNIMTHEFGHWCALADLYSDVDYWLTMYGYSNYGETYKRTLGFGDINGLKAVYGT